MNTTHNNVNFINHINSKIPSSAVIDTETINTHDLLYQCSNHGPGFPFDVFRIKAFSDEPHFPKIINIKLNPNEYVV